MWLAVALTGDRKGRSCTLEEAVPKDGGKRGGSCISGQAVPGDGDKRGGSCISEQAVQGTDGVALYSFFIAPIPFLDSTIAGRLSRAMKFAAILLPSFTRESGQWKSFRGSSLPFFFHYTGIQEKEHRWATLPLFHHLPCLTICPDYLSCLFLFPFALYLSI